MSVLECAFKTGNILVIEEILRVPGLVITQSDINAFNEMLWFLKHPASLLEGDAFQKHKEIIRKLLDEIGT